ncbi:hypothetical protein MKX01_011048 [Papaver californicum]|nr:hypothetical protein MKX01_011048 [Papaver californicum]
MDAAAVLELCLFLSIFFFSLVHFSSCQSNSPQNLGTFFPSINIPPPFVPPTRPSPDHVKEFSVPPEHRPSHSTGRTVAKAVGATSASTIVVVGLFFFFLQRYAIANRKKKNEDQKSDTTTTNGMVFHRDPLQRDNVRMTKEMKRFDGTLKGIVVDEDGLDVLYWRKLEGGTSQNSFKKEILSKINDINEEDVRKERRKERRNRRTHSETIQETLFLRGSSNSSDQTIPIYDDTEMKLPLSTIPPPQPPPLSSLPPPPSQPTTVVKKISAPPPPPHLRPAISANEVSAPAPPLPPPKFSKPSPPPPKGKSVKAEVSSGKNPKTLQLSPTQILRLDALQEGRGLDSDTLEKLAKFSPTEEEETTLVEFDGNITKLADAESFLYHIFKVVRYPFVRLDAMLFRLSYEPEILQLKNSLKILESGCNEMQTRGLFLKLLEAILKAGNRMNAGTARGNAKAFNLTALRKLSDVKSSDGKTTLLHFVVEEVVRFEGKHCVLNKNNNFSRSNSRGGTSSGAFSGGLNSDPSLSKEDREKEYMTLGLPIVGGLSTEFANVKRASTIDYEGFGNICTTLTKRVAETRKFMAKIDVERSGFVKEMKSFLDSSEEELKAMKTEQERIMNLVKRTTQYYQAGTKDKDNPLHLFVIVHDFIRMVDQVCIDISRIVQKKKPDDSVAAADAGSSTSVPASPPNNAPIKFPYLPVNFLSDKFKSSSSGGDSSDNGF